MTIAFKLARKLITIAFILPLSVNAAESELEGEDNEIFLKYQADIRQAGDTYQKKMKANQVSDVSDSLRSIKANYEQPTLSPKVKEKLFIEYVLVTMGIDSVVLESKKFIYNELYKANTSLKTISHYLKIIENHLWAKDYTNLSIPLLLEETKDFIVKSLFANTDENIDRACRMSNFDKAKELKEYFAQLQQWNPSLAAQYGDSKSQFISKGVCRSEVVTSADLVESVFIEYNEKLNSDIAYFNNNFNTALIAQIETLEKEADDITQELKKRNLTKEQNSELVEKRRALTEEIEKLVKKLDTQLPSGFYQNLISFNKQYELIAEALQKSPKNENLQAWKNKFEVSFKNLLPALSSNLTLKKVTHDVRESIDLIVQLETVSYQFNPQFSTLLKGFLIENAETVRREFYTLVQNFNRNLDSLEFSNLALFLGCCKEAEYLKKYMSVLLLRKIDTLLQTLDRQKANEDLLNALQTFLYLKRILIQREIGSYLTSDFLQAIKDRNDERDKQMLALILPDLEEIETYSLATKNGVGLSEIEIQYLKKHLDVLMHYSKVCLFSHTCTSTFADFLCAFSYLMKSLEFSKNNIDAVEMDRVLLQIKLFEPLMEYATLIDGQSTINTGMIEKLKTEVWKGYETSKLESEKWWNQKVAALEHASFDDVLTIENYAATFKTFWEMRKILQQPAYLTDNIVSNLNSKVNKAGPVVKSYVNAHLSVINDFANIGIDSSEGTAKEVINSVNIVDNYMQTITVAKEFDRVLEEILNVFKMLNNRLENAKNEAEKSQITHQIELLNPLQKQIGGDASSDDDDDGK